MPTVDSKAVPPAAQYRLTAAYANASTAAAYAAATPIGRGSPAARGQAAHAVTRDGAADAGVPESRCRHPAGSGPGSPFGGCFRVPLSRR
jgi:hypothetical protein